MFELLSLIGDVIDAVLIVLDIAALFADLYSCLRGHPNRNERKVSKQSGTPCPKPDKWYWCVVIFTVLSMIITAILVIRYASRMN